MGNVDYVVSYAVPHNGTYVLGKKLPSPNIIKKISFISQKAKQNICQYFKTMKKYVNLVFYA